MTVDFTKKKVGEIRKMLIAGGMSEDEANGIKGKAQLVASYEAMVEAPKIVPEDLDDELDEIFAGLDIEDTEELNLMLDEPEEEIAPVENEVIVDPRYEQPDTDTIVEETYDVMDLFTDEELADGKYPKAVGLRRVAQLEFGPIVKSGPTNIIMSQDPNGLPIATVVYTAVFQSGLEISEVADAWNYNTPDTFAVHPSATASTRAEGRAFRKLLGLNTLSAEEMDNDKDASEMLSLTTENARNVMDELDRTEITAAQIGAITSKCKTLGIDVEKFINKKFYTGEHETKTFDKIESVTYDMAKDMIRVLNLYQGDHEQSKDIPEEIKV